MVVEAQMHRYVAVHLGWNEVATLVRPVRFRFATQNEEGSASQVQKLSPGVRYTFKTYDLKGEHFREGLLISVSTKYQDKKDEDGKTVGRRLVGDCLVFEPLGEAAWTELFGERLKVYSTTVGRGLFEIFSD